MSDNTYVYSQNSTIDKTLNIVAQSKNFAVDKIKQPVFEALSIFFMTFLWVFGTLLCSRVTITVFGYYYKLVNGIPILNNLLVTIILNLIFISLFLYVFERNIFYPVVKFLRNEQKTYISDYGILTSATIGITLGMNIPQLSKKLRKLVRIFHYYQV
tara:strand:- start:166 stop:636 length:471 start_codon:yes stop_codon:yes gene_type:complete